MSLNVDPTVAMSSTSIRGTGPAGRSAAGARDCDSGMEVAQKAGTRSSPWCRTRRMWLPSCSAQRVVARRHHARQDGVRHELDLHPSRPNNSLRRSRALVCQYLDAPGVGRRSWSKGRDPEIMGAGTKSDSTQVKPLFELMGKKHHAGRRQWRTVKPARSRISHRWPQHRGGRRSAAV